VSQLQIIGKYDWSTWLMGLWRALIGGGCNAILSAPVSMGIDPEHFNLTTGVHHMLEMMGGMFVGGAILHMVIFLSTHQGPEKTL
jgi:hypothetical protein